MPEKRTCTDEVASESRCTHRKLPSQVSVLQRNRYEHIAADGDSLFPRHEATHRHTRASKSQLAAPSESTKTFEEAGGGRRRKTSAGAEGICLASAAAQIQPRGEWAASTERRRWQVRLRCKRRSSRSQGTHYPIVRAKSVGSEYGMHRKGLSGSIMVGVTVTLAVDQLSGPNHFSIRHTLWTTPPPDDNATRAGSPDWELFCRLRLCVRQRGLDC